MVFLYEIDKTLYHEFADFPLIYAVQEFPQDPVKGGAYNWLEYLMNKLNSDCCIGHDTSILLYKYSWINKYSCL